MIISILVSTFAQSWGYWNINQLKQDNKLFQWSFWALDEWINVTDTFQLLIIQAVSIAEVASMNLHGTTTSDNIFKVEKTPIQHNLKWNLLRCILTEMVAKMCKAEKDLVE